MEFVVTLEMEAQALFDEAKAEHVLEALADYAASVWGEGHRPGAILSVDAAEAREALAKAVAACSQALGEDAPLTSIRVETAEDVERELEQPQIPPLASVTEFADILGVSRQRAWDITQKPDFPQAISELKSGPIWLRKQLEVWAATHERKPGRPRRVGVSAA